MDRSFKGEERGLFIIMLVLISFGLVMIYSSSSAYGMRLHQGSGANYFFLKQLKYFISGLLIFFIILKLDYKIYQKYAVFIYLISYILSLLVFSPLGRELNNARRWIAFGPLTLMPSDFLKIGSVMFMAYFLDGHKKDLNNLFKGLLKVLIIIAITVLPVYKQPNLSTTIVIAVTLYLMYGVSGANKSHFILGILLVLVLLPFVFQGTGNEYRLERIKSFRKPLENFYSSGWQLSQSLFAVSSGGLFGVGLGRSSQSSLYLSEAHNDFIFAIICEETGFFGACLTIILIVSMLILGLRISYRTKDFFGKLLSFGLTLILGIQSFVNIAVVLGLIPATGLALPFISYGGSSLWTSMTMVAILLNISKNEKKRGLKK